jgi:hypothetical protein
MTYWRSLLLAIHMRNTKKIGAPEVGPRPVLRLLVLIDAAHELRSLSAILYT